ncbi:MAG: Lrp/AsnC family transcriptional regulator [Candidatus Omnitrophica bacterium]|jgi:Transcriptional regulators|nr:Lrp/AsnC family transcriptional regulator [Candidatus Omnitrophota bacterium]
MKLTALQKKIIGFLQQDLPSVHAPYRLFAEEMGVDEQRIIKEIKFLKKSGAIRRFGAVLSHHKVGLKVNCMCVWDVPGAGLERIGRAARRERSVSHCYERERVPGWTFNFYTMIHGRSKTECEAVVRRLSRVSGIVAYRMLFTKQQFKKTSPRYEV